MRIYMEILPPYRKKKRCRGLHFVRKTTFCPCAMRAILETRANLTMDPAPADSMFRGVDAERPTIQARWDRRLHPCSHLLLHGRSQQRGQPGLKPQYSWWVHGALLAPLKNFQHYCPFLRILTLLPLKEGVVHLRSVGLFFMPHH